MKRVRVVRKGGWSKTVVTGDKTAQRIQETAWKDQDVKVIEVNETDR